MQVGFPTFEGFRPADKFALLLRLKNVEPHNDPWVGMGSEPRKRRAIFWLLNGGRSSNRRIVHFGCGGKIVTMRPGDFVVFNDARTHWVMSGRVWYGAAAQLMEVKR